MEEGKEEARHSVDSVASYSSQNHVDRIRTKNFSANSCQEDEDTRSSQSKFQQQRSLSNLEFTYNKRPESVISTASSTKSRLREFVERKTQDDQRSTASKTGDLEYFENPTETLEFSKQRSTQTSKKCQEELNKKKKVARTSNGEKCYADPRELKPRKHEKYQSKLAEYYNLPNHLPQDDFYQHLTRSRASSEDTLRNFNNSPDAEFNESYTQFCKGPNSEGTNLRRSRSLAVIREETFTDLQIHNHSKHKRSQLIPRARLFDKPGFKDRLPGRSKHHANEEAVERIYNRSTNSCFGDFIGLHENHCESNPTDGDDQVFKDAKQNKLDKCTKSVGGSWPNIAEAQSTPNQSATILKNHQLSEDSINHSRNPSEIDSLDSNYVRKHYNFEANQQSSNYIESSPEDTERTRSPTSRRSAKQLFILCDDKDIDPAENKSDLSLPHYFDDHKYDTDRSISNESDCAPNSDKSQTDFNVLEKSGDIDLDSYDEVSIRGNVPASERNIDTKTITKATTVLHNNDTIYLVSDDESTVSTPSDSITSYVSISIPSSNEKSRKLENLANSLAEKIDEYCEAQFSKNQVDKRLTSDIEINHSNRLEELSSIYTKVKKGQIPDGTDKYDYIYTQYQNKHKTHTYLCNDDDFKTRSLYRQSSSSKNITTEPYVTTLIENQYYSLPDINISKSLRKSERIDAKLREEDPEDLQCENIYEVTNNNLFIDTKDIDASSYITHQPVDNYGQINVLRSDNFVNKIIEQSDDSCDGSQCYSLILRIDESNPNSIITKHETRNSLTINETIEIIETDNHEFVEENVTEIKVDFEEERSNTLEDNTIKNHHTDSHSNSDSQSNESDQYEANLSKDESYVTREQIVKKDNTTAIKRHYSLRQREPSADDLEGLILNTTENINKIDPDDCKQLSGESNINSSTNENTCKENSLVSRVKSFKKSEDTKIIILPLSGHQTIIIDPPSVSKNTFENNSKEGSDDTPVTIDIDETHESIPSDIIKAKLRPVDSPIKKILQTEITENNVVKSTVHKTRKDTSEKIAAVQYKFEKPPSRLIIKDTKPFSVKVIPKVNINMTRPQVLQIVDSTKQKTNNTTNPISKPERINSFESEKSIPDSSSTVSGQELDRDLPQEVNIENNSQNSEASYFTFNVSEKINKAVKTDIEYQEKLHSVKSYWSKLIDKNTENTQEGKMKVERKENSMESLTAENNGTTEKTVENYVKNIESVKIVDSIKKSVNEKANLWKDETEQVKDESEIEDSPIKKIVKEIEENSPYHTEHDPTIQSRPDYDPQSRSSPDIEIVELGGYDGQDKKTQATLIKPKGYNQECADFDHVRYKVMKSELFRNSMIANYRKEAQFDGLLQYLQDYSFQELLVNNNVVIIEPVRTKVEQAPPSKNSKRLGSCRIPSPLVKKEPSNVSEKSKSIHRHFFYHPIRVNKEIIEEELPNPDTVKKVRNLFEDSLKMRSPESIAEPGLIQENVARRASYRNFVDDTKLHKNGSRKKLMRFLTIDTSFGSKKWDNASLSSGVSSGDLSSNTEYENDGMSPLSHKNNRDHMYSSSSEEYLCDSLTHSLCYESQYVSQDILKKIRDCGTSITYYGGKVLNEKSGPAISPMTKAIMEEIRGLQKNCSPDCISCQTKCLGGKCRCLHTDAHKDSQKNIKQNCSCTSSDSGNHDQSKLIKEETHEEENKADNVSFKFKLVKSNSCSSRLELAGTDDSKNPRLRFRNMQRKPTDDPPIVYDIENSVKNKVCRIESYKKGIVDSPFDTNSTDTLKSKIGQVNAAIKNLIPQSRQENKKLSEEISRQDLTGIVKVDAKTPQPASILKPRVIEDERIEEEKKDAEPDENGKLDGTKSDGETAPIEKKYYVNNKADETKTNTGGKFGEMVFEEFEVLESCYDSLNSTRSSCK